MRASRRHGRPAVISHANHVSAVALAALMSDSIDQGQLEALLAVVAEGTFDAAAHALHVTPSAISQRIRALETRVGRVLLRRSKPVTATPAGASLLQAARQIRAITD